MIYKIMDRGKNFFLQYSDARIKKKGLKYISTITQNKKNELKLDLGSGDQKRPGFIGIDLNPKADLQ